MAAKESSAPADPEPPAEAESATDAAVRTIDDVRKLLEGAGPDDLGERAAAVREKLQAALQGLEEAAGKRAASIGETVAKGQKTVEREIEGVEQLVRENPIGAVVVAAGVGFVLGLLMRRGD